MARTPDPTMELGKERIKKQGKPGRYRTLTVSEYRDGKWVRIKTEKEVLDRRVDGEVLYGTKEPDVPKPPPPPEPGNKIRYVEIVIPFGRKVKNDPNLPEGQTRTEQEGRNGSIQEAWQTYVDEYGETREKRKPDDDRNRIEPRDEIVVLGTKPVTTARQVFEKGISASGRLFADTEFHWADSGWLLFQGSNLGESEIYRASMSAPAPVAVARGHSFAYCEASDLLYFGTGSDASARIGVCRIDGSGRNLDLVKSMGRVWQPVPSPDGRRLAFLCDRDGDSDVFVAASDGSNPLNVSYALGAQWYVRWNPAGTQLSCLTANGEGSELALLSPSGDGWEVVTQSGTRKAFPEWSPDGQWVAFWSEEGGRHVLQMFDVRTREVRSIPGLHSDRPTPIQWSTSSQFAYTIRHAGGQGAIVQADPAARNVRTVYQSADVAAFTILRGGSEVGVATKENGTIQFRIAPLR